MNLRRLLSLCLLYIVTTGASGRSSPFFSQAGEPPEYKKESTGLKPADAQNRFLRNEIVIRSTVDKAWNAMTSVEGMKAWSVRDAVIEMKTMGKYYSHYTGKVGDVGTVRSTVLSFIPKRMFSTKLGIPENFMVPDEKGQRLPVNEVIKAGTIFAVTEFEDIGKGEIRVSVTLGGFQSGREWDLVYNVFERGNSSQLTSFKKYLESN
jgi:uncharacterized protein YndB with AHSA1/START domain